MLKIRLQRIGRRHDPQFRVVVTDARRGPKSGNFIELVGSYNAKQGQVTLKADRIKHWISVGAKPSVTVYNFMVDQKIVDGPKINALPKKTPIIKEPTPEEVKAAEDAAAKVKADAEAKKAAKEAAEALKEEESKVEETPAKEEASEEKTSE